MSHLICIAIFDLIVGKNEKNEENSFSSFFSCLPPLNHKSRFSRSETLKKSEVSIRRADMNFFLVSQTSKTAFSILRGKNEKHDENEKVSLLNGKTFPFS